MLIFSAYHESGTVLPTHFVTWYKELETGLEQEGEKK